MLRWMTSVKPQANHRSMRRGALAGIVVLALALLVILGPLLVVVALGMLGLARWAPHRIAPHLGHRWLTRVPSWLRATPMRFATAFVVATLPFAAARYAIRDDPGASDTSADASPTLIASEVAAAPPATPTPEVAPSLRPSPRARARPSVTVAPTETPTREPSPEPTVVGAEVAVHFLDVG